MNQVLQNCLHEFKVAQKIACDRSSLCVVLYITRVARREGLPLAVTRFETERGGQVAGLNGRSIQAILWDYGIETILSREGGRTSMGSVALVGRYISFLNELWENQQADLLAIEQWWIAWVPAAIKLKYLTLRHQRNHSHTYMFQTFLARLKHRRYQVTACDVETVMKFLVGAQIEIRMARFEIPSFPVFDGDQGDIVFHRTAFHVAISPNHLLLQNCKENLASGFRPIIMTTNDRVGSAHILTDTEGITDRVEILAVEQFLATNLYLLSEFGEIEYSTTLETLVSVYNTLIDRYEIDPSLRISIGK